MHCGTTNGGFYVQGITLCTTVSTLLLHANLIRKNSFQVFMFMYTIPYTSGNTLVSGMTITLVHIDMIY